MTKWQTKVCLSSLNSSCAHALFEICVSSPRHVILPKELAELVPKTHLMTESEWRNLGVQQSPGWIHYLIHAPGKEQSQLCIVVTCWWYTGTSPLGHLCSRDISSKCGPEKNVNITFVFVTSILGTPLFRGKGQRFLGPKPRFNLHSGDTLAIKRWLITKSLIRLNVY